MRVLIVALLAAISYAQTDISDYLATFSELPATNPICSETYGDCQSAAWTASYVESLHYNDFCAALCAQYSWCPAYLLSSDGVCRILTDVESCPQGELMESAVTDTEGFSCFKKTRYATTDMECLDETDVCEQQVESLYAQHSFSEETAEMRGDLSLDCVSFSQSEQTALSEFLDPDQVSKLCSYSGSDTYYYQELESLPPMNTCVVMGSDPTLECDFSAARVCSGMNRGLMVVGTVQQQAKVLHNAIKRSPQVHPQCTAI